MAITVATLVSCDDRGYTMSITPGRVYEQGIIGLVKGGIEVWDVKVAAFAVLAFGDD